MSGSLAQALLSAQPKPTQVPLSSMLPIAQALDTNQDPMASQAPTMADAMTFNAKAYGDWAEAQKQDGIQKGLIDPQTGWPTPAALVDAARQYGNALIGGTIAPGEGMPGITAYHGSPKSFESFNPKDVEDRGGLWLTNDPGTARMFALDKMGAPPHNPKRLPYSVMQADISGNLQHIDPMAEATHAASQIGSEPPQSWDDAAEMLQWSQAQKNYVADAKDAGYDGIAFHNVGDSPNGSISTHYVVFDPKNVRITGRKDYP